MMWVACALSLSLAAGTGFGPTSLGRHPMVGPVAPVPGNGPEPTPTQAPEEVPLHKARGKAGPIRARGSANPLYLLFLVYKNYLTEVDGGRCQHYPTCSAYGAQAVGRHNVLGVLMTLERLWAGSNSSSVRPLRLVYGVGPTPRFYDPVEDTSFFFSMPLVAWFGPSVPTVDRARGRTADAPEPTEDNPPHTAR